MSWDERPSWSTWWAELSSGRPALRPSLPEAQAAANPQKRRPERSRVHQRLHPRRRRAGLGATASLTSAPEAPGRFHASHRARRAVAERSSWAIVRWRFYARQSAHAVRTLCARCSASTDCGGGQSPAPSGNAPTSGRARLAIDAHRGRAWRAKSPSADPCLATQLRAEGPGSSNAEGVPTSFGASTYSQCGRFVSPALKLQEEVPIATGEIKAS